MKWFGITTHLEVITLQDEVRDYRGLFTKGLGEIFSDKIMTWTHWDFKVNFNLKSWFVFLIFLICWDFVTYRFLEVL